MKPFYPYSTSLAPQLELRANGTTDESQKIPGDVDHRELDVRALLRDSGIVELEASVRLDGSSIPSDVSVVVIARCRQTNVRQATKLAPTAPDRKAWKGALGIDARNYRGQTEVVAIAAGSVDGMPDRRLDVSDPWSVILDDEASATVHGAFEVVWTPFDGHQEFGAFPDQPFMLALGDPTKPVLHLNSSIEGFQQLLPTRSKPIGPYGALYELSRTGIVLPVWISLLQVALAGIRETEIGYSWPDVPWQEQLLRTVLPKVFRTPAGDANLELAIAARPGTGDPAATASFMQEALAVLQKEFARSGKGLRSAIQAMRSYGEGTDE